PGGGVGGGVAAAAAWQQRMPGSGWWGYGDVDGEVVWCCCRPRMGAKGVVVVPAVVVVARDSGVRWRVGESGVDDWIDRSEGNNFGLAGKSPSEKFSGGGSMVAGGGCRILGGGESITTTWNMVIVYCIMRECPYISGRKSVPGIVAVNWEKWKDKTTRS
nr:hypothetical protein [Tanacetum cinerariifolium]